MLADLDYSVLVNAFKQIAAGIFESQKPFSFVLGKVLAGQNDQGKGLKIMVDQKLILGDKQLITTNAVRDFYIELQTVGETLGQADGTAHKTQKAARPQAVPEDYGAFDEHDHEYKGKKWWKVNLKLKAGEHVLMMRVDGGQKYIVLDRVFPPNNKGEIR